MATAKPAAASLDQVLAAHIRTMHAVMGKLLGDLGRSSAYGIGQAMLQAGASGEDIRLVHDLLTACPPGEQTGTPA